MRTLIVDVYIETEMSSWLHWHVLGNRVRQTWTSETYMYDQAKMEEFMQLTFVISVLHILWWTAKKMNKSVGNRFRAQQAMVFHYKNVQFLQDKLLYKKLFDVPIKIEI